MPREIQDHYFRLAKKHGYHSRAAYKLIEIDDRKHVLATGVAVLDCGAAPGSWTQVALQRIGQRGCVVAVDLQPVRSARDARLHVIQGDLTELPTAQLLAPLAENEPDGAGGSMFDVILSDMAPSTSGDRLVDHYASIRLCESVLDRAGELLRPGGNLVIKVFEGEAYPALLQRCKDLFPAVKGFRPKASRTESTEMFIVATGFRAPQQ